MNEINEINVDLGRQRDWVWRGWQIRYTYLRSKGEQHPKNPPLLLVHGFGASIEHWRYNLSVLSETHTVYALDLLGFGASRKAFTRYSVNFWSDLLYQFWRTVINVPTILIGNSLGSLVSLTTADRYPDMVHGLILINLPDPSVRSELLPPWGKKVVNGVESLFAASWLLRGLFLILRSKFVIRRWAKLAYPNVPTLDEDLVNLLSTPPQDEGAADGFVSLVQSALNPDFAPLVKQFLPHLELPMLLLWGELDRLIPVSFSQQLTKLNPNLELVILPKLGHCPHDESPEEFQQVVLPWLKKLAVMNNY